MEKKIIAGLAALLLSAGVAVAQSNSDQSSASTGTAASQDKMQSNTASDTSTATTPKKARRTASGYPRSEARLNREEAETTKQLNIQEAQDVASNGGANGPNAMNSSAAMNSGSNMSGNAETNSNSSAGTMNSGTGSSSQPQ